MALPHRKKSGHRKAIADGHKSGPEVENPPRRTDRSIPQSWTYSVVFSGAPVPFLSPKVLSPKGPPAAERLARIVVLWAPNCSQSIRPSASSSP